MENKRDKLFINTKKDVNDTNTHADIDYGGNETVVPNGLPARIVRHLMMCKGGLVSAGSIYYGTGRSESVAIDVAGEGGTITYEYDIPEVSVLVPPTGSGRYKLIWENGVLSWELDEEEQ